MTERVSTPGDRDMDGCAPGGRPAALSIRMHLLTMRLHGHNRMDLAAGPDRAVCAGG